MVSERRPDGPVPSFASNNECFIADKENTPLASPHSPSRCHGAHSRRRCARTFTGILRSQSLSAAARTQRHRARHRTPRPALYYSQMIPNNEASPSIPSAQQVGVLLPRRLSRPVYREIDLQNLTVAIPSLEGIPLQYIRQHLEEMGPRLLRATRAATTFNPDCPRTVLREITLICDDLSVDPPSHVIAVCSKKRDYVALFPAHSIVLSAYCANVPTLPASRPNTPSQPGETITVPVFAFELPAPTFFPAILTYLYTKRSDLLRNELLPAHGALSTAGLVQAHAAMSQKELILAASKVKLFWANTCVLGIYDEPLFKVMEFAWDVLVRAMEMKGTLSGPSQSVDASNDNADITKLV